MDDTPLTGEASKNRGRAWRLFRDETTVALAWAMGSGAWHPFAELVLRNAPADEADLPLSFDPVRNTLPGLENYEWVRRLREPSYMDARSSRGI